MRKILLGTTALVGLMVAGAAQAADMPLKAAPAPIAAPYSWSGFYVGAHLGAGWARKEWTDVNKECFFDDVICRPQYLGEHNAKGVLGGFQAGYNWQVNPWLVLGIEGQYSFADIKGDHGDSFSTAAGIFIPINDRLVAGAFEHFEQNDRFSTKVKDIATIAGRIGIVSGPSDRTMWFVKGGAAYAKDKFAVTTTTSQVGCIVVGINAACADLNGNFSLSADQSRWGWMVGTGLEFGLYGNWSAKVEYDYLDLGDKNVTLAGSGCLTSIGLDARACGNVHRDVKIDQTLHVIKFGINYHFNWAPAVAARY